MPDHIPVALGKGKSNTFSRGRREGFYTAILLMKLSSLAFYEFLCNCSCPTSYGGDEGENNPSVIL